ncbi:MAG: hypothetical protein AAFY73_02215 [Pseudomonadota bacterium]
MMQPGQSAGRGTQIRSLRILPAMGFVLVICLMLAERAGLPEALFTQIFLIIVGATIGGIALGTRTLDGQQFFRPSRGGQASTRGVAIGCLTGLGFVPIALPTLWQGDSTLGLSMALAVSVGGLVFVSLIAPALHRAEAPDIARLAVPDHSSPWLRAAIYLLSLLTCLAALAALSGFFLAFETQQELVQDNFITRGAIGLAVLVAILGGRAGVVRLAALALPISIIAGAGVATIGAGLELDALRDLSRNELLRAGSTPADAVDQTRVLALIGICLITATMLGTVLGNAGFGSRQAVVRTPVFFYVAMASGIAISAGLAAIGSTGASDQQFAIYSVAENLDLPIVFRSAATSAVAAVMCAAISATMFACSSILLRGVAPIFTQRRQADGRQLFRARLLLLSLGVALIFSPTAPDVPTFGRLAMIGAGALAVMGLPLISALALLNHVKTWHIGLSWLTGLGSSAALIVASGDPLTWPSPERLAAATPVGVAVAFLMVLLLRLVANYQFRRRAMI